MPTPTLSAVTGAFGYSGKYIAQKLLDQGHQVITLTNSLPHPDPFQGRVRAFPFNFDRPAYLAENLRGVRVLYNTYWVRFNHKTFTHTSAVQNSLILFEAAMQAGVERIVHVSITNPALDSHLEYFRGKAELERALASSGISYAILRPTVLFGREDILINNIAWALRHLPIFGLFGDGNYRLQPIFVDDLAALAVSQGQYRENTIINAIGPETFTYRVLVEIIGRLIGKPRAVISMPPWLGYLAARLIGWWFNDVTITRPEIAGLMADLLYVDAPPAGPTRLTDWIKIHSNSLGREYHSELARRKIK